MSSIQTMKNTMYYEGIAPEHKQCKDCLYATQTSQTYAGRHHCGKGGYFVAGVGGCSQWQPKKPEVAA